MAVTGLPKKSIDVPEGTIITRLDAAIDRLAYPDLPEETQLLWYKDLSR